jgi:hypothetical protein
MKKVIINLIGYFIGFACINSVIPEIGTKEFFMVALGGAIIIFTTMLFPLNDETDN